MNFDVFPKKAKDWVFWGIVVTKDGKEIGKKTWDEQCRRNVYSASKVSLHSWNHPVIKKVCYPG